MSTPASESPTKVPQDQQFQQKLFELAPHLEPIFEGHPFKDNLTVGIVDMQTPYAFVTGPGGKLIPMPKDMEKPAGKWTVLYCHCKEHGMVIQSIKNDPQDLVRCLKDVQAEFEAREEEEKKKAERADCS